jgi:hypothetical protein
LRRQGREAPAIRKASLDFGGDPHVIVVTLALQDATYWNEKFGMRAKRVAKGAMDEGEIRQNVSQRALVFLFFLLKESRYRRQDAAALEGNLLVSKRTFGSRIKGAPDTPW